jgi:branched-chain amino acid transport system substrate-binding protein
VRNRILLGSAIAAVALLAALAVAVAGPASTGTASALPKTCGPLFYKGSGSPKFIIVSDLPLQGAGRAQNLLMGQAIRYTLEKQYKFKAGKYTVGYQECDDSTAQAGRYDPAVCSSNARGYASTSNVIGILGTFNSGCSKLIIPIVNRAPGGPIGMVSSANTAVGLTHYAPWNDPGEPNIYYPTKKRNYVRVAASDDFQGPAMADFFVKKLKKKTVYILQDNTTFGKGVAQGFQSRANKLGLRVLAFDAWSEKATDYTAIAQKIKDSGAQSVYLGGLVCDNGVKLLKDLRSVLGPKLPLGGPDGWTPESATLAAGSAAQGFYITYAGQPLSTLGPKGKAFIKGLTAYAKVKGQMPPYPVYQGHSAQVLLDAIARSNGTRTSVTDQLFRTNVKNGIMGTFHFDKFGDIAPNKYITIEVLKGNTGVFAGVVVTKVNA